MPASALRTWTAVGFPPLTRKIGPRYEVDMGERARQVHQRCAAVGRKRAVPSTTPAYPGYSPEFPTFYGTEDDAIDAEYVEIVDCVG